jgi:hypothetical protein
MWCVRVLHASQIKLAQSVNVLWNFKQEEKFVLGSRYNTRVSRIRIMHKTCQSSEETSNLKVGVVKEQAF